MGGLIRPRGATATTAPIGSRAVERAVHRPTEEYSAMRLRVQFDRNHLDDAVERHSQDFLEICERQSEAQSYLDQSKDELARKDSEIARAFRVTATKAGEKCTDSIVDDHVRTHPEHIRMARDMVALRVQVDNWKNLRDAFEHRKRMLQEMVALYLSGYYSDNAGARNNLRDSGAAAARQAMTARRTGTA